MSRPWNVADTGSSRNGERADLDRLRHAAGALGGQPQQPVVGADQQPSVVRADRHRPALGADLGIDHRKHHAGRQVGQRAAEDSAPARTSWRGIPWVMSITAASGQILAITAWQTPTNSSARP